MGAGGPEPVRKCRHSNAAHEFVEAQHLFIDVVLRAKVTIERLRARLRRPRLLTALSARSSAAGYGATGRDLTASSDSRCRVPAHVGVARLHFTHIDAADRVATLGVTAVCATTVGIATILTVLVLRTSSSFLDASPLRGPATVRGAPDVGGAVDDRALEFVGEDVGGSNAFRSFTAVSTQRRHSE